MSKSDVEKQASVSWGATIFGWLTFCAFIAGVLALLVFAVVLILYQDDVSTDTIVTVTLMVSFWSEYLALFLAIGGFRHHYGEIGAIGAVIILVVEILAMMFLPSILWG